MLSTTTVTSIEATVQAFWCAISEIEKNNSCMLFLSFISKLSVYLETKICTVSLFCWSGVMCSGCF